MPNPQLIPNPDAPGFSGILQDEEARFSDSARLIWTNLDESGQIKTPDATIPCPEQHVLSNRPKIQRSDGPISVRYPPIKTA